MSSPLPPNSSAPSRRGHRAASLAVRLAALWLLAGALFKLLKGTPADLPTIVQALPFELGLTYKFAILIELCLGGIALLRPRWAWPFLVVAFVVFDLVLVSQIADGASSCGCFGSDVPVSPWAMLGIDTALLLAMLFTRPWARLRRRPVGIVAPLGSVAVVALAVLLPFVWFDRQTYQDGAVVPGSFLILDVESWTGTDVWDTELGQLPLSEYIDVTALPLDGLWVFWRATCDHCAAHLEHLEQVETGERFITLIQLEEPHDSEANRVVHRMPVGNFVQHAALPPQITYVIQTPAEMTLEGGRIVSAAEAVGDH